MTESHRPDSAKSMFPSLFSPIQIGSMELKNRIVSTGHSTGLTTDGLVGAKLLAYYEARAQGGVGLMITGSTSVHPTSSSKLRTALRNWDDDVIEPYRILAERTHRYGARMVIQLNHAGGHSGGDDSGGPPVAASWFNFEEATEAARVLDEDEIRAIVAGFAAAAVRVREAGLDGVEVHGGHGNLIQQFLSPLTNRREDGYGGSEAARARFACEILRAVRTAVGDDFVVGMRYCMEEPGHLGLTVAMSQSYVPMMVQAGRLDYISITRGVDYTAGSLPDHYGPMYVRGQHMRGLSRAMRGIVSLPLLSVGRITDPRDAEDIIASGDADLVGMTRALIADRELPVKARNGQLDAIRYCVGANEGCLGRLYAGKSITCIQDPTSGRELELGRVTPAATKRNVLVIGGGVAGLEAARVAALRGHQVILLEKSQDFGGQLKLARIAPGREELGAIADQLLRAAQAANVDLRSGIEATADAVAMLEPDAVILATGSQPKTPPLEDDYDRLVTVHDALEGAMVGESVAVFDMRGDMIASTTAEWLAASGRSTWLITPHRYAGRQIEPMTWQMLHGRLLAAGVTIITNHDIIALTDAGIDIRSNVTGNVTGLAGVVTVVASAGGVGRTGLVTRLKARLPAVPITVVGDAVSPRNIEKAILEGHLAARRT
jgi:2,4-dienoyl-CoA reductase-like NADH-dependent reductase (Old Yellow Enzyme family)/thioredoxin reductase